MATQSIHKICHEVFMSEDCQQSMILSCSGLSYKLIYLSVRRRSEWMKVQRSIGQYCTVTRNILDGLVILAKPLNLRWSEAH